MPITVTGIASSLQNLSKEQNAEIERELRERALRAFADVRLETPVDTGRARNSWYIGYQAQFKNELNAGVTILTKSDTVREIIVTNGTDYIQFLNDGSSVQAPTRFIEAAFSRYFDSVRVEVI